MTPGANGASRLSWLLLLLCLGLGYLLYQELAAEHSLDAEALKAVEQDSVASPSGEIVPHETPSFALPALAALKETVERPLFTVSRRPPAAPTEAPQPVKAAAPVKRLALSLRGILISAGEERAALLQLPTHKALQWVREGEQIEGWQVDKIEPDRIILRAGDATESFELKETWKLPPPAQPAKPKKRDSTTKEENAPSSTKPNDAKDE